MKHPVRTTIRLLCDIALIGILLSVAGVGAFRFIDPPSSAFMMWDRLAAVRAGASADPIDFRWRRWESISKHLAISVVAAEDQRFTSHRGFDFTEIRRAMEENKDGRRLRGASTITQQLAKNLFLWSDRSYLRKGLEAWFTMLIEGFWPKKRILEVYLNIVQFGPGVYGAEAAAQRFFSKPAAELSPQESALLAAALPGPSIYSVRSPGPKMLERQKWILRQIQGLGGPSYLGF